MLSIIMVERVSLRISEQAGEGDLDVFSVLKDISSDDDRGSIVTYWVRLYYIINRNLYGTVKEHRSWV